MSVRIRVGVFAIAFVSTGYVAGLLPVTGHAMASSPSVGTMSGTERTGSSMDAPQSKEAQQPQSPTAGNSWVGHMPPGVRDPNLPPDEDAASEQLAKSPRHAEWVDVPMANAPAIRSFVVLPESKPATGTGVVIVIHEAFGLTEWVRGVADQLAKHALIAVAPDLLSGKGPNGGGTDSLGDRSEQVTSTLTVDDVVTRLNAVRDYAIKMTGANGRVASIGFGWGGGMSFSYALKQPRLNGAVSFYGPIPSDPTAYSSRSRVPILGLYGQADSRTNENIPFGEIALGTNFSPNVYFDAGPGFVRQQKGQNGANLKATMLAWGEALDFLRRVTSGGVGPGGA